MRDSKGITMSHATKARKTKTYIDVAYKDRELAKRLGARWDASVKRWYCPADSTLALIYKWRKASVPASAAPAPEKVSAETAPEVRKTVTSRSVKRVARKPAPLAANRAANSSFDFGDTLELPLAS